MTRLPNGTRRAAGGDPDNERRGAIAPPTLAPSTSASASGCGSTCAAASAITSSTIDRLECTSQVIAAATRKPRIGSPASPVSIDRIVSDSLSGAAAPARCDSASSMQPRPIEMRATPRALSASVDRNVNTPNATSNVHSHLMSNEKACAAIDEPTSAPSMTASASGSAIRPRPAKEASRRAVAVELCRMPVTPMPARNALMRVRVRVEMIRRSVAPKARIIPVRTIRTPQSRSATLPRNVAKSSVPDIPSGFLQALESGAM